MSENIAVLKGFVKMAPGSKTHGLIKVWCPYCACFHNHGYIKGDKNPFRCAHCTNTNYYKDSQKELVHGYYIQPFSKKEIKDYKLER